MEGNHTDTGKNRNRRVLIIAAAAAAILLLCYIGLCFLATAGDAIFPGVRVADQWEVGGMSVAEAQKALESYHAVYDGSTSLTLTLSPQEDDAQFTGAELSVTFDQIGGVTLDCAATAQAAYDSCRSGSFFSSGYRYLKALVGGESIAPVLQAEQLKDLAPSLCETLSQQPVNGAYTMGTESVFITKAKDGFSLTAEGLTAAISQALQEGRYEEGIAVPYTITAAKVITAQEVHTAAAREVKNAGYDPKTDSIYEAVAGAEFDAEEAQRLLDEAQPGETVEIPAVVDLPAVTAEELEPLLFRDVLGTYKTHVSGTSARISNVKKSAAAINGYVLNSGDVFSYNDVVGERTAARGYQAAPAYVNGETVNEIGGGICQTSSTLYMAALLSDLEIVTRYAHRYVPAYIPKGMDATVSWGGPEFRFANNTDYPIKIVATYSKNYLTVTLYGTNLTGKYVKMTNEVLSTTPYQVIYEDDPTLPKGTEKVKTSPYTGYKVRTYRNVYSADGKLISSTFEASSDYKVRNKVIIRGTKEVEDVPTVNPGTPENPGTTDPGTTTPENPGTTDPGATPPENPGTTDPGTTTPENPGTTDPGTTTPENPGTTDPGTTAPGSSGNSAQGTGGSSSQNSAA